MLDSLLQDTRYGMRLLLKRPAFAFFAVATLAIGIGVNTAIFSVIDAVLLRPLPFQDPSRLVLIWCRFAAARQDRVPASGPQVVDIRQRSRAFENIAGIWTTTATFTGNGEPEQVRAALITANFFSTLGVKPALGRSFLSEEELSGARRVIMLSDGMWRRRFAADPGIVGHTVQVGGGSSTVVGVMPAGFKPIFPADASVPDDIEAWIPMGDLARMPRDQGFIRMIGRLRSGITLAEAQADLSSAASQIRKDVADDAAQGFELNITPLHADVVRTIRTALLALFGAVALVALIACANVANLLLARTSERRHEITIRAALGASPSRILRQILTESILLSLCGGAVALLVGSLALSALPLLRPTAVPRAETIDLNPAVFLFTSVLALACGVALGLGSAFSASRMPGGEALKEGTRSTGEDRRYGSLLIAGEVALGLLLLVGAGLMSRTLVRLMQVDPGFVADNVLTFQLSLPGLRYPTYDKRLGFTRELERTIAGLSGVRSVGASSHVPFASTPPNWYDYFWVENAPPQQHNTTMADLRSITPGFFRTMGIALVAGREFTEADDADHPRVIIVDQLLAANTWPGRDPLGQKLNVGVIQKSGAFVRDNATVVGVVRHVKYHNLMKEVRGEAYEPFAQSPRALTFVVRTSEAPEALIRPIRAQITQLDKDLPMANVRLMSSYLDSARAQTRFSAVLSDALALIALLLVCVGTYGVTSLAVVRRTREIGVRIALGAQPTAVVGLVLRQGMTPVLIGIAIGLAGSLAIAPLLRNLLFGVGPVDPLTFGGVTLLLAAVALCACYVASRRAVRIEPLSALRAE